MAGMFLYRVGSISLLLATIVFIAANLIVPLGWRDPTFDWTLHNVSDLGNVTCGIWDATRPRFVCSPWHTAMNVSLGATGVLLCTGMALTWRHVGQGVIARVSQTLVLAGASGYAIAGLWPADIDENAHVLGALLIFVLGNAGVTISAAVRRSPVLGSLRILSATLGSVGLVGTALFLAQLDIGIGVGGMERVALFPLFAWVVVVAIRSFGQNHRAAFTSESPHM